MLFSLVTIFFQVYRKMTEKSPKIRNTFDVKSLKYVEFLLLPFEIFFMEIRNPESSDFLGNFLYLAEIKIWFSKT